MSIPTTVCSAALGSRLSDQEALDLYTDCSIHELGRRAHQMTLRLHPEPYRTYVVDRNINYANYCTATCIFCEFKADVPGVDTGRPELPQGYVLSFAEIGRKIEELVDIGGTQVLMQGGLVPANMLPFGWYLDLLAFIKREYPGIHVHAFSPPEIHAFHQEFGMTLKDVLSRLQDAGLDSIRRIKLDTRNEGPSPVTAPRFVHNAHTRVSIRSPGAAPKSLLTGCAGKSPRGKRRPRSICTSVGRRTDWGYRRASP